MPVTMEKLKLDIGKSKLDNGKPALNNEYTTVFVPYMTALALNTYVPL